MTSPTQQAQQRWLKAINTSAVDIPPFAVVGVKSADFASAYDPASEIENEIVFEVGQDVPPYEADDNGGVISPLDPYDPTSQTAILSFWNELAAFNGRATIASGEYGAVTYDDPLIALVNPREQSSIEFLVPKENQWALEVMRPGDDYTGESLSVDVVSSFLRLGQLSHLGLIEGFEVWAVRRNTGPFGVLL